MSIFNADLSLIDLANRIIQSPNKVVAAMHREWTEGFLMLHDDPNRRPSLLQQIGVYGVELFQLNNLLTTFMVANLSGVRNDIVTDIIKKLDSLPNFIFNDSGIVNEVLVTSPSASAIFYNEPLSASILTGGSAIGGTTIVPGNFLLTDPGLVPSDVGIFKTTVNFVPISGMGFKTTTHNLSVLILPIAMPSATFIPPTSFDYDGEPKEISFIVPGPRTFNKEYTGRNSTTYVGEFPPANAGDYRFTVTSTDPNYVGSDSYDYTINSTLVIPPITSTGPEDPDTGVVNLSTGL